MYIHGKSLPLKAFVVEISRWSRVCFNEYGRRILAWSTPSEPWSMRRPVITSWLFSMRYGPWNIPNAHPHKAHVTQNVIMRTVAHCPSYHMTKGNRIDPPSIQKYYLSHLLGNGAGQLVYLTLGHIFYRAGCGPNDSTYHTYHSSFYICTSSITKDFWNRHYIDEVAGYTVQKQARDYCLVTPSRIRYPLKFLSTQLGTLVWPCGWLQLA